MKEMAMMNKVRTGLAVLVMVDGDDLGDARHWPSGQLVQDSVGFAGQSGRGQVCRLITPDQRPWRAQPSHDRRRAARLIGR
jgi:hypothetical protein